MKPTSNLRRGRKQGPSGATAASMTHGTKSSGWAKLERLTLQIRFEFPTNSIRDAHARNANADKTRLRGLPVTCIGDNRMRLFLHDGVALTRRRLDRNAPSPRIVTGDARRQGIKQRSY
ncbi:hypothetical protein PWP93_29720 [Paraburkholderia sp. A1RI-2L]|uniref:hypothetical protein n=1 Tax=Paraburkholderia sp. A1RI-2L TaxID=3028367 RepID=UPI003B79D88D